MRESYLFGKNLVLYRHICWLRIPIYCFECYKIYGKNLQAWEFCTVATDWWCNRQVEFQIENIILVNLVKRYKVCILFICLINLNNFVVHRIHYLSPSDVQLIFGRLYKVYKHEVGYYTFISSSPVVFRILISPSNNCPFDYKYYNSEDKITDALSCLKKNITNKFVLLIWIVHVFSMMNRVPTYATSQGRR